MSSLWAPLLLNHVRVVLLSGRRTMALPFLGLVGVATVTIAFVSGVPVEGAPALSSLDVGLAAWSILGVVGFNALAGPFSTRFPHRIADVAWLYTTPLPLWAVGAGVALRSGLGRATAWLLGGVVIDVVSLAGRGAAAGGAARALAAAPVLIALSAWEVAASSVRERRVLRASIVVAGVAGLAVLARVATRAASGGSLEPVATALDERLALAVGGPLLGVLTSDGLAVFAALSAVSAVLLFVTPARFRERLVLEASFWSDFTPTASGVPSRWRRRDSWRGGSRLVGAGAFCWFELAVLRRAWWYAGSMSALVGCAALAGWWQPQLLVLLVPLSALSSLLGAYAAGAVVHVRSGSLLLLPGSLPAKALAAELPHAVAAALPLSAGLVVGGAIAGWDGATLVLRVTDGLFLLALAFAVRLAAAAFSLDGDASPAGYLARLATAAVVALSALIAGRLAAALVGPAEILGVAVNAVVAALVWQVTRARFARRASSVPGGCEAQVGPAQPLQVASETNQGGPA